MRAAPLTFADASERGAYQSLRDLLALDAPPLAELALAAAAVPWWSRWQPLLMHRAFVVGASLSDVALATCLSPTVVIARLPDDHNVTREEGQERQSRKPRNE